MAAELAAAAGADEADQAAAADDDDTAGQATGDDDADAAAAAAAGVLEPDAPAWDDADHTSPCGCCGGACASAWRARSS